MPKNELIKPSVATNCSVTQKNFVKGKLNKTLMYVYLIDTRKLQLSLSHKDFFCFIFIKQMLVKTIILHGWMLHNVFFQLNL